MSSTLPKPPLEDVGDNHVASSIETPLRGNAFEVSNSEKIEKIASHFRGIMETLGLDLTDDSLRGTPLRVAKMYIDEVFSGLDPANKPATTLFDNKFNYNEMVVEKEITFYSHCEHHFVPIIGKAHVAYISSGTVIGLSKINRVVQYYAKRPQVQERLTIQIAEDLKKTLQTEDVAVVMDADHLCVSSRGVNDTNSKTGTAFFSGKFKEQNTKAEFLNYINNAVSK
ncbi:MAG: GTP cyclohydrolase I FolE [Cyclobacteriaceae bacterium]|nr:GTP cyclohydrolase I FolE [Cyclobacteriaceae bacterium]